MRDLTDERHTVAEDALGEGAEAAADPAWCSAPSDRRLPWASIDMMSLQEIYRWTVARKRQRRSDGRHFGSDSWAGKSVEWPAIRRM